MTILLAILIAVSPLTQPIEPTEQMIVVAEIERIADKYPDWSSEYTIGVFDCSEMSAYVSYRLTVLEIENRIVVGESRGYRHAWVETKDTTIECTSLTVYTEQEVYYFQSQPRWEPSDYKVVEARTVGGNEWDWFNVPLLQGTNPLPY